MYVRCVCEGYVSVWVWVYVCGGCVWVCVGVSLDMLHMSKLAEDFFENKTVLPLLKSLVPRIRSCSCCKFSKCLLKLD